MKRSYDPVLFRLVAILAKLFKKELPNIEELAEEFNVSKRTIQKDIYERLMPHFPIEKTSNKRFKLCDDFDMEDILKQEKKEKKQ